MEFDNVIEACYSAYNERQELLKGITTDDEAKIWQSDTLHFYRMQLEPYVFNYLNHTYGKKLDKFWKTHTFPKKADRAFVIVERRIHPNWWFVLRNIAWAAPHFSLYIFCSDLNYNFIKSILGEKADNVLINCFKGNPGRDDAFKEYNITLKLPAFYKQIDAEYCIIFQMDSYFLQKIPDWIFTGVYFGSPWCWNPTMGGNGGLTVRNIKSMIDICEKEIDIIKNNEGEDWHFSKMIEKYNHSLPSLEFRQSVFQENYPTRFNPIGTHQFWTYLSNYNIGSKSEFTSHFKKLLTIDC
jgi:hypothetical protein